MSNPIPDAQQHRRSHPWKCTSELLKMQERAEAAESVNRELREALNSEKAKFTALRIMVEGHPGAAQNAVREDYPELANLVDGLLGEKDLGHDELELPPCVREFGEKFEGLALGEKGTK